MFKTRKLQRKEYGKVLLDNLDIEVREGEVLGILGDEMSGRKEFFDIIRGIIKPNSGEIFIGEEPVVGNVIKSRKGISTNLGLDVYDNFTINGFLKLMVNVKNVPEEIIEKEISHVIEISEIKDKDELKISDLDNFKKQKLAVATACMGSAKVILLEDPFLNLKDLDKQKMKDIILKYKENKSIIIGTNDEILKDVADIILVLTHKGQIEIDPKKLISKNISLKEKQDEILKENNIKGKHYDY